MERDVSMQKVGWMDGWGRRVRTRERRRQGMGDSRALEAGALEAGALEAGAFWPVVEAGLGAMMSEVRVRFGG